MPGYDRVNRLACPSALPVRYSHAVRTWTRIGGVLAAVALLLLTGATAAATNIVFYTFDASLDTGSLAGTSFPVCYSYDADQVAPAGESYVTLNSFDFTLLGSQFTRNDIFQGGQVIFEDGVVADVTASFQVFLPPGSPVHNITFGFGGPGVIGYSDLNDQYGDGSFALDSQSPGCGAAPASPRRPLVRTPSTGVQRSHTPPRPTTGVPHPVVQKLKHG